METVVSPPAVGGEEPRFLTDWEVFNDRSRSREAAVASVVIHVLVIGALAVLPAGFLSPPLQEAIARNITPLIAPLIEPTQTTPNKGPLSKEFNAETMAPRPRIQVPPSLPSTTRPAARNLVVRPNNLPGTPAPPTLAEPPRLDAGLKAPVTGMPPVAQVAPPQIEAQERPRLEAPSEAPAGGRPTGRVAIPNASVAEAVRSVARGGGGGVMVGDAGDLGIGGIGEGINLPPSPGRQASNLELLSDPMGVDFRPYLIKILAAVRRNWFAVMPESAKLGRPGRVGIQFAIDRNGAVPKLVIVGQSGTEAFDRAAVASISASNPFPPLPTEFKGNQVRLQFNFAYNIPRNR